MTPIAALSTHQDPPPGSVSQLASAYRQALEAQDKSPRTIQTYLEALARLDAFLQRRDMPLLVALLRREHLEAFIDDVQSRQSPATAVARYRALQSFFRWCEEDGEIERNPMAQMRPPAVSGTPTGVTPALTPAIPGDAIARLLQACEGREFRDLRDMAIIRLFIDTGLRRNELAMLRVTDIDLAGRTATVPGRDDTTQTARYTPKTGRAIERYLRAGRASHPNADSAALWLGHGGPMTGNGIYQAIEARTTRAGLERIHPHRFRQTFAHEQLRGGSREVAGTASDAAAAEVLHSTDVASSFAVVGSSALEPTSALSSAPIRSLMAPRSAESPRPRVDLSTELLEAMRVATARAKIETLHQVRAEGATVIERIEARSSAETAEMRREADQDTVRVEDGAATEIARIREEAESSIVARRAQLDGQLQQYARVIEEETDRVRERIAAFEAEMTSFFDELAVERDPATLAVRAAQVPRPPSFEDLGEMAIDRSAGDGAGAAQPSPQPLSAGTAPARGTGRGKTLVSVAGLVNLASIARYKRELARLVGVRAVSVSSGRDGVVLFEVAHDPATSLSELIRTIPDFAADVIATGNRTIDVSVRDPQR